MAMIQEIQHSRWAGMYCTSISMLFRWTRKIEADIPLEAAGIANGVKNFGDCWSKLRVLAVECLPRDLRTKFTVDVSA